MYAVRLAAALALFASSLGCCAAMEALVLLQRGAALLDSKNFSKKEAKLHTIEEEFSKSLSAWDTADAMQKLEANLEKDKERAVSAVAKEKQAYETNISSHRAWIHKEEGANERLRQSIEVLRKDNTRLRSEARKLVNASDALVQDIAVVRFNITTVASFLAGVLAEGSDNTSALEVLRILDAEDEESEEKSQQSQALTEVQAGGVRREQAAMLQTGAYGEPHDMFEDMVSALNNVSHAQDQTLAVMRQNFESEFHELVHRGEEVKIKQGELTATRADEVTTQQRLRAAVQHLCDAHKRLLDQSRALRTFAASLNEKSKPRLEAKALAPNTASEAKSSTATEVQRKSAPSYRTWATGLFASLMGDTTSAISRMNSAIKALLVPGHAEHRATLAEKEGEAEGGRRQAQALAGVGGDKGSGASRSGQLPLAKRLPLER